MHLAMAPGKQGELRRKAHRKMTRFGLYAAHCAAQGGHDRACIAPLEQDRRFSDPAWQSPPFNLIFQSFLLTQQWWYNPTTGVRGVPPHHQPVVEFPTRQILDTSSPTNNLLLKPAPLAQTTNHPE